MNCAAGGNDAPVSRNASRHLTHPSPRDARVADVPPASRAASAGWRDPRLWIGVVLVTGSVVVGARVLAGADDMTPVWSAADDLVAGQTLTADDLVATPVRFGDDVDRERYLATGADLPATLTLTRPLAAGELVPASALGEESTESTVTVSIAVPAEHVPTDVVRGSRVDVWVIAGQGLAGQGGRRAPAAELVLGDVVVLDAPLVSDAFVSATSRQLVLAVPDDEDDALGVVLAASGDDRVRVVGRG